MKDLAALEDWRVDGKGPPLYVFQPVPETTIQVELPVGQGGMWEAIRVTVKRHGQAVEPSAAELRTVLEDFGARGELWVRRYVVGVETPGPPAVMLIRNVVRAPSAPKGLE